MTSSDALRFAVVAVDTVLLAIKDDALMVRLVRAARPPHFDGNPSLPGGLLGVAETAEQSAMRHLRDKAGITAPALYAEQLFTFSDIDRDPRGRVVAVSYLALVSWESLSEREQSSSYDSWWEPVRSAKTLAYDHDTILSTALARLRSRVTYTTLIAKLMPAEFTLTELERAFSCVTKHALDKRNFRKKILKLGILSELPKKRVGGRFRPAQLYRFASKKVVDIEAL